MKQKVQPHSHLLCGTHQVVGQCQTRHTDQSERKKNTENENKDKWGRTEFSSQTRVTEKRYETEKTDQGTKTGLTGQDDHLISQTRKEKAGSL